MAQDRVTSGQRAGGQARLHQFDGLRAVAVCLVMLHHAGGATFAETLMHKGHTYLAHLTASSTASGVEFFFVLSGVLLLRPHLRGGRALDLGVYARRRIQRLWPPFLAAWLAAGAVIWSTTHFPSEWSRSSPLATFSWGSWFAQMGIVYVGPNNYNWPWWSLTVELMFYALVPVIVALLAHRPTFSRMRNGWLISIALAVASNFIPEAAVPQHLWPLYRFAIYVSCFAAGTLIAADDPHPSAGPKLAFGGLVYVLLACQWPLLNLHVGWGIFYFGVVTMVLDEQSPWARAFSQWPLVWLGERSYSLFLIHYPVFLAVCHAVSFFSPKRGAAYYLATRAIELPLAVFAAMVIFSVVERRFAHNLVSAGAFWPTRCRPSSQVTAPAV